MIKKVFYSYSHKDELFLKELKNHLKPAIKEYQIEEFVDENIRAGEKIDEKILSSLNNSDLIILLISADYLASESCQKEMNMALNDKKAFPVIIKDCDWKNIVKEVKVLPKDGKAVDSYDRKDEAYKFITSEFRKKIQDELNIIKIKANFKDSIEKIDFLHPYKFKITLNDTFIAPNIREISDERKSDKVFKIEEILQDEDYREVLFFSPFYSGKTSLLKYSYLFLLQQNIYPLYIEGKNITKTKYFDENIKRCFNEQYDGDYDKWKNLNKFFLIDDYNRSISSDFIEYLRKEFDNVKIIVTIEQEEYFSFFKDFLQFTTFRSFELRPLNRRQQEEMIKKWLILKDENIQSDFYNKVDIIENQINNIVSSQIILPRYPTNILLILQTIDSKTNDMKITSYGHCYYALILNYLTKNGINEDSSIDTSINFLSELSYDIFYTKEKYTKEKYNNFKKKYKNKFIIQDSIINRLESGDYQILHIRDNENVRFEQDFIYYYFLGKILAEKISREDIESFCEHIHQKINMYVIVFIIHHSKNMELIDEIILRCMLMLDNTEEASYLRDETHNFVDKLDMNKLIMNAKSVEENRSVAREIQNDSRLDLDNEEENENEVYKGMKLSEVLSQILKNRSGSFNKDKVKEIVDTLISLRLRVNKMIFDVCEDEGFEKFLIQSLKEFLNKNDNKKISDDKAQKFVKKLVALLSVGGSLGIVNETSFLIYADNIIDDLDSLVETNNHPSREIILFLTSIKKGFVEKHLKYLEKLIDQYKKNKNFFALKILSYSMQLYLNTHNIDKTIEFKMCDMLSLPKINRAADRLLNLTPKK